MIFAAENGVLTAKKPEEIPRIEASGKDSLWGRTTRHAAPNEENWTLTEKREGTQDSVEFWRRITGAGMEPSTKGKSQRLQTAGFQQQ